MFNLRHLWIKVLEKTCNEYGIIISTYPTRDMSDDEIIRAACRPSMWPQMLERLKTGKDPLRVPIVSDGWSLPKASYQRLTPGGRYLVSVNPSNSDGGPATVSVWDFGVPGGRQGPSEPTETASWSPPNSESYEGVSSCTTNTSIFVLLTRRVSPTHVW